MAELADAMTGVVEKVKPPKVGLAAAEAVVVDMLGSENTGVGVAAAADVTDTAAVIGVELALGLPSLVVPPTPGKKNQTYFINYRCCPIINSHDDHKMAAVDNLLLKGILNNKREPKPVIKESMALPKIASNISIADLPLN